MTVLIVGAGFAGRLHAEAWRRLGEEVAMYDPRLGIDRFEAKLEKATIVDFCDTPASRLYYSLRYADVLREKRLVVYEKPPVPPQAVETWRDIVEYFGNVLPVHNYLYMPFVDRIVRDWRVDIRIFREGPHKAWYPSPLTGGGILVDHGYHWMYVARELLRDQLGMECVLLPPTPPDYHASCRSDRLSMLLTWAAPYTETWLNGERLEKQPFSRELQVRALEQLFGDTGAYGYHADASVDVLRAINRVYSQPRPPVPREGPDAADLVQLLPAPPQAILAAAGDAHVAYRATGRIRLNRRLLEEAW